jgi:hypothetical protein
MSKTEYGYGWPDPKYDPRVPNFGLWQYQVRYAFNPDGYQVVKQSLLYKDVAEILASGLTKETADGYVKLLKEE